MNLAQVQSRRRSVTRAALFALTAGLSLGASVAHAAIVDSGPVNIAIPPTFDGIYLNLVTGQAGGTAGATPGWDINPYGTTSRQFFWAPEPGGGDAVADVYRNLAVGDTVGPASTFLRLTSVAAAANFNSNAAGTRRIGLRFVNENGGTTHFGYIEFTSNAATGVPAAITRYVFESTPNTAITVAALPPPATPPVFGYTPAAGSTVTATGGTGLVGSTSNLTITPSIQTAGTGTGAAATTTLTCTAPAAPFAGFGQTVTAIGDGAISGGPLAGTCTRGTSAATATLTCSENQGGTAVSRTWTLNCPAGTIPSVPVNATSTWSLIALMLALFGFAAVAVRRQS